MAFSQGQEGFFSLWHKLAKCVQVFAFFWITILLCRDFVLINDFEMDNRVLCLFLYVIRNPNKSVLLFTPMTTYTEVSYDFWNRTG